MSIRLDEPFIHRLPNEILISVFMFGLQPQHDSYEFQNEAAPFPVLVSTVCARWRRLAITSPSLWTYIDIFSRATLHTAKLFFERSTPCSFDLILCSLYSKAENELTVSITAPHVPRMRSLTLEHITLHDFDLFANAYSARPASSLQSLKIWVDAGHDWRCTVESDLHKPLLKGTDSLRSLVLYGACSRLLPPLVDLSHLEICHFFPTYAELRDLFVACPSLTTLCLPMFLPVERIGETQALPLIDASSLKALSVGLGLHNDDECKCLLSLLKMDNLEHLEITGAEGRCNLAQHFPPRSNALENVRTLRLQGVAFTSPTDDVAFYGALTSVTRLELIDVRRGDRLLECPQDNHESKASPNFPRVSTVLVSTQWATEFSQLVDTLCARSSAGTLSQLLVPLAWTVSADDLSQLKAAGIEVLDVNNQSLQGLAQYDPSSVLDDMDEEDEEVEWWYDGDYYDGFDYYDDLDYDHDEFGSDGERYMTVEDFDSQGFDYYDALAHDHDGDLAHDHDDDLAYDHDDDLAHGHDDDLAHDHDDDLAYDHDDDLTHGHDDDFAHDHDNDLAHGHDDDLAYDHDHDFAHDHDDDLAHDYNDHDHDEFGSDGEHYMTVEDFDSQDFESEY